MIILFKNSEMMKKHTQIFRKLWESFRIFLRSLIGIKKKEIFAIESILPKRHA